MREDFKGIELTYIPNLIHEDCERFEVSFPDDKVPDYIKDNTEGIKYITDEGISLYERSEDENILVHCKVYIDGDIGLTLNMLDDKGAVVRSSNIFLSDEDKEVLREAADKAFEKYNEKTKEPAEVGYNEATDIVWDIDVKEAVDYALRVLSNEDFESFFLEFDIHKDDVNVEDRLKEIFNKNQTAAQEMMGLVDYVGLPQSVVNEAIESKSVTPIEDEICDASGMCVVSYSLPKELYDKIKENTISAKSRLELKSAVNDSISADMEEAYNEENGFPEHLSALLDELSMGIDTCVTDSGYTASLFNYTSQTGTEFRMDFELENGTLSEFINELKEAEARGFFEVEHLKSVIGAYVPSSTGSTMNDLVEIDAEEQAGILKEFTSVLEQSYPDLSDSVVLNKNTINLSKDSYGYDT